MKWTFKEPVFGDMIRVKTGSIYHYGIFASADEILQFGLAPYARLNVKDCDVEVCVSDIETFLNGNFVEVGEPEKKELKKLRTPQQIVSSARSRLGEKNYNILYNNCEHFAYQCVFGEKFSSQTQNVRDLFRSLPIVDVYVAKIPQTEKLGSVYPAERNKEIYACSNEAVRREKYYVWKLLEYALERTFGQKIKKINFEKLQNGTWVCDKCYFSLSHSKNAVAVAVSRKVVGVDIEIIQEPKVLGLENKILNDNELNAYNLLNSETKTEFLIKKWSEKESIFKTLNKTSFLAANPKTFDQKTVTKTVFIDGESYALSVASENTEKVRWYEGVDLLKL